MTHRDLHPNDLILIYGDIKIVERVDRTHIATRGPHDSLELWAYSEQIQPIEITNKLVMKSLGFYEENNTLKYDIDSKEIIIDDKGRCYIPYSADGYTAIFSVEYLHEVQQHYFHVLDKELKFDI